MKKMSKTLISQKTLTLEKSIYNIRYNNELYKVSSLIKHPIKEYKDKHIIQILKYIEHEKHPELNRFYYTKTTKELINELLKILNQNKDE